MTRSSWRAGVYQYPKASEAGRLVLALLQRDFGLANVTVETKYGGECMVAQLPIKEGAVVSHTSLVFPTAQGAQQMLADRCNGALL